MSDRQARASRRRAPRIIAAAAGGLLVAVLPAPVAVAGQGGKCENRSNNSYDKLLECVTLDGVREHQQALQDIADKNQDPYYPARAQTARKATKAVPTTSPACSRRPGTT
jgi:hypothetical protein